MSLSFDTTHEYFLRDADLHYCEDHECLLITKDYEDKLLINGISYEEMLSFARKLVQKDLDKMLAKYEDKETTKEETVNAE